MEGLIFGILRYYPLRKCIKTSLENLFVEIEFNVFFSYWNTTTTKKAEKVQ